MSDDSGTGEKTERPTSKRLQDARKEGNVPKSKDLSQTVTTLIWALLLIGLSGFFSDRIGALLEQAWVDVGEVSITTVASLGFSALKTLLWLTLVPLGLVGAVGILSEFLQAGPVLSFKKIIPRFDTLNPAQGLKRIFSLDNIFETGKSIFKTAVLIAVTLFLVLNHLNDLINLMRNEVTDYAELLRRLLFLLMSWIVALFLFFSILDWFYQKFSHLKKLRMSKYDIKREHKDQEGDPQLKGKRKQLHRQWANQNARRAAREASAIVVNPTHIAVALFYRPEETVVPIITVKGEGPVALMIRSAAEEAGVPIVRNIPLARALNYRGDEDDFVPEDLFEAVAEVLAWAEFVKTEAQAGNEVVFYKEANANELFS